MNIDVRAELEQYDWGYGAKWTYDKLVAPSPFRYDKTPSFFVRLEPWGEYPAGIWADSGAYDNEYASGDFPTLLSFLRNETREETEEYLHEMYAPAYRDTIELIKRPLRRITQYSAVPEDKVFPSVSKYLTSRKISESVQVAAGTGRGEHLGFCALPWRSADGKLLNIKYRATRGKTFFYERGATPIRNLIYGAETVMPSSDPLVICEAEIDALSWRTAGMQAVAIGGVSFSYAQADILKRLPVDSFALAGDNDKAGQRFNARIIERLGSSEIRLIQYFSEDKDANEILKKDAGISTLRQMFKEALILPRITSRLLNQQ